MTKHPSKKLRVLPGGQRAVPVAPIGEAVLPLEARMATKACVEALSEPELSALVHNLVVLPIQASPWGTLDTAEWRRVADVLLSELLRRREASSPDEPDQHC